MSSIEFIVYVEEKADIDVELKTTAVMLLQAFGDFKVLITNNGNTAETLSLAMKERDHRGFFT